MIENRDPMTILCLASEFKGVPFITEAKKLGCRILLIVKEKYQHDPWPRDCIDEIFPMPILWKQPDITYGVSYLARSYRIDRIVALDDYDVETVADLREHLRLPGLGHTVTRYFRDKLAMRMKAREAGIPVPAFTSVVNYDDLRVWMSQVPSPWVLKPRFEAGAIGIEKISDHEGLWQTLHELGDKQSFYLLEQFMPGNVFHVDSITWDNQVIFNIASKYGLPPLSVSHGGGVFTSRTLPANDPESQIVTDLTQRLMQAFGLGRGVSHTEFIQDDAGNFYFLETAARVGGANLDKLVYAASGINMWAEAARVQVADMQGQPYQLPLVKQDHAGIVTCLARQEHPKLSQSFNDPEVVWYLDKPYHAGLILASPDYGRVTALINQYAERFAHEFVAVGKKKEIVRQ